MLKSLHVENIALIKELDVEFDNRFNIMTGETGAGKSIIIDALNFVLGERADKTLIKNGTDYSLVEAHFIFNNIHSWLDEFFNSVDLEPENELIIYRYMSLSGKNECKVNGKTITIGMLKSLTKHFVDVLGQHDHQALLDVKNHIKLLDQLNEPKIVALKENISHQISVIQKINNEIDQLGGSDIERAREIEILKYQIDEIMNANISEKDEQELLEKRQLLQHSQRISENLIQALDCLKDGSFNVLGQLKQAERNLTSCANLFSGAEELLTRLSSSRYELEDIAESMADIMRDLEYSDGQLNAIEERLDVYSDLKRKYGKEISDILGYLERINQKLFMLENCDVRLQELNAQKNIEIKKLFDNASVLTDTRKQIAKNIKAKIETELREVGMKNATFEVAFLNQYDITNIEKICSTEGADEVEFMFSANLGEPVKPLSKIISGGEMSRFMLAFKCVVDVDNDKTFVFDEIDTGIGGDVANIIANKLSKIAKFNQVLCITHLAQIASHATTHFKIEKMERDGMTMSQLTLLNTEARIYELARMIGSSGSEPALLHARQMLENGQKA